MLKLLWLLLTNLILSLILFKITRLVFYRVTLHERRASRQTRASHLWCQVNQFDIINPFSWVFNSVSSEINAFPAKMGQYRPERSIQISNPPTVFQAKVRFFQAINVFLTGEYISTLFHPSVFHYFRGLFPEGLRKKPTKEGRNERQTAHKGKRQNGVHACHLHNEWRARSSNAICNRRHTHPAISERRSRHYLSFIGWERHNRSLVTRFCLKITVLSRATYFVSIGSKINSRASNLVPRVRSLPPSREHPGNEVAVHR